jgi:hypothetical protein
MENQRLDIGYTKAELEDKFNNGNPITDEQYEFIVDDFNNANEDDEDENTPSYHDYLAQLIPNIEYWMSSFVPRSEQAKPE